MTLSLSSLIPMMIASSLTTMIIQRRHLLMALLALEGAILMLTMFIVLNTPQELFFALITLTFGACEASLGLACLVAMTRSYGNDFFSSISLSKC